MGSLFDWGGGAAPSGLTQADIDAMNNAGVSYVDDPSTPLTPQEQSILFPNMQGPVLNPGAFNSAGSGSLADVGGGGGGGFNLKGILGGLGGLASALGPALAAAGRIAQDAMSQRPTYRPIPTITAPAARTEGGTTQPLKLGGSVTTQVSPMEAYVKLIQGLR